MNVGIHCTREVVITKPETEIRAAAKLMRECHVGDLVVVEHKDNENIPVGILTDRDLVVEVLALDLNPETVTVADIMSFEPVTVSVEAGLFEALEQMRAKGIRRLLVVNKRGGLEGILTADDVLELMGEAVGDLLALIKRERTNEENRLR